LQKQSHSPRIHHHLAEGVHHRNRNIMPVLIGEGIPLFAVEFPQREFKLTESKTYSGVLIALKYERVRGRLRLKLTLQVKTAQALGACRVSRAQERTGSSNSIGYQLA
jgi:hypothetical protein